MGREVRRVPADWKHPKDPADYFIPLHDNFLKDTAVWLAENKLWARGLIQDFSDETKTAPIPASCAKLTFTEYMGPRPNKADYMPDWPAEERTHWQMYENTTEGTPISPVFATPEELGHWLADTKASAFGGLSAPYDHWMATIKRGWAISAVGGDGTGLIPGVSMPDK